ncbi:ribosome biogenesis Sqt1 [Pyrrhoderma noxium]|uniref:Ribosome biogenesis Sqt1 n=1 Tax=Pyrrhoderma noxium TaxID=2282107 RepID=A0A286U944_9AGAM|nr:ribosome biogenesis Sqt1 [Pyrrhoderma noxium]
MADKHEAVDQENVDEDAFLNNDDVLVELGDDGDFPMDEELGDGEFIIEEGGELDGEEGEDTVYEDNSIQHFPEHEKSVFAVSMHPTQPIAASGGEDDLGYLWNVENGETLVKLTGHTDSVIATAFSSDGELVSTGGMDGKVRVWRRVGKENWSTWEFLTEVQGPDEVLWLRWHPRGAVLLAGSNDGMVWLWQLPSGNTMQVFAGHTGPVQCGEFTPDGKRIVTADSEGTLLFWDPRSPTPIFKLSATDARFSLEGITSLSVNASSSLAVVGGVSGGVRVVSLSKGEVVGALEGHDEDASIEAVQFIDLAGAGVGSGVVVTGGTDGKACIWDLSTMRLRATLEHEDAITSLVAHPSPKNHLITSGSADKTLKTWDARTGKLIKEHKGHHGPIHSAALGPNGSVVVSAGDDGVCLVFAAE